MKNINELTSAGGSGAVSRKEKDSWLRTSLGIDIAAAREAASATPTIGSGASSPPVNYVQNDALSRDARGASAPRIDARSAPTTYVPYDEQSGGARAASIPPRIDPVAPAARAASAAPRGDRAPASSAPQTYRAYGAESAESGSSMPPRIDDPVAPARAGSAAPQTYRAYGAESEENGASPPITPRPGALAHADPNAPPRTEAAYQSPLSDGPELPGADDGRRAYESRLSGDDGGDDAPAASGNEPDAEAGDASRSVAQQADETELPRAARPHWRPVDAAPTATGMKTKRVGAAYEGEHNQLGWRKEGWKAKDDFTRDNPRVTTKLYSDQEQAANELIQQPGGEFKKGDDQPVALQSTGYTMDASGRMVSFKDSVAKVSADGTRTETQRALGELRADPSARIETRHHSTALGGEAVVDESGKPVLDREGRPMVRSKPAAAAGVVDFDEEGRIKSISNESGHYKPTVDYLLQAVEHLLKQGAFFEDEPVRLSDAVPAGEKYKPLPPEDEDYQLYKSAQAMRGEVQAVGAQARELNRALAEAQGEAKQAEIGKTLEALKHRLAELKAEIEKAEKTLREHHVGPSNRIRQEAKVSFIEVAPEMTGRQVREAVRRDMDVASFMASGGGNEAQARNKKAVLDELKRKKDVREGLKKPPPKPDKK